jgi:hypothetical protein
MRTVPERAVEHGGAASVDATVTPQSPSPGPVNSRLETCIALLARLLS